MLYAPTHTVDVLTSTLATDDYGDATDGVRVAARGVPASILERAQRTSNKATDTPRRVTVLTGRVPSGTTIGAGDRLRDPKTGTVWLVDAASHNTNPAVDPGITLDLRRVP